MLQIEARDLLFALENQDFDTTYYLDRQTGEITPAFGEMFEPEDPEYVDEEALRADPRYLPIDPISSNEGFRWMEQFAATVTDRRLQERLFAALDRRRPFRGFKDVLLEYSEEREAWFEYHEQRLLEAAREWLGVEGIEAELTTRSTEAAPKRKGE